MDFWEILYGKHDALVPVQQHISPVIVPDPQGFYILPGGVRTGIHMGNEARHRSGDPRRSRQGGHYIAMVIQGHISKPQGLQFFRQGPGKHHLSRGAGQQGILFLVGLGVKGNILQKTVHQFVFVDHGIRLLSGSEGSNAARNGHWPLTGAAQPAARKTHGQTIIWRAAGPATPAGTIDAAITVVQRGCDFFTLPYSLKSTMAPTPTPSTRLMLEILVASMGIMALTRATLRNFPSSCPTAFTLSTWAFGPTTWTAPM